MKHGKHLEAPCLLQGSVEAGDAHVRAQDELGGKVSQGHDPLRIDGAGLLPQVVSAQLDFLRPGVPVAGRSALQHVGNEHVLPLQARIGEQLVEVLARRAHEGLALQVFVLAGSFAHYKDPRLGVAHPEHRLGAAIGQEALLAGLHLGADLLQGNLRPRHSSGACDG